jgi:hypothetical protein
MHSISHSIRWRLQRQAFARVCKRLTLLLGGLSVSMVAAGCDDSFTPIEPSEIQFSVFGYLDASADTQWIRVMPLRSVVTTTPEPLGAVVTVEHLGTGRIIQLRDSVFRFRSGPDAEGVYLHNFWTTERIEPGAAYRFSSRLAQETASEAVVQVPPDYDVEVWLAQAGSGQSDSLRVAGLKHLGLVIGIKRYHDGCIERVPLWVGSAGSEVHTIAISTVFRPPAGQQCFGSLVKTELLVVGSGAAWPSREESSVFRLGVPDVPSSISNAVGFLGGVLTKLIPYDEVCLIEGVPPPKGHCRLRYNASSVTLRGTVRDALCGGDGIGGATVRLRELDPESPGSPQVRLSRSSTSGEFRIYPLEAGRRYALSVTRVTTDPLVQYQEHTDTLRFAPGEHANYDVGLRRLECRP